MSSLVIRDAHSRGSCSLNSCPYCSLDWPGGFQTYPQTYQEYFPVYFADPICSKVLRSTFSSHR